MNTNDLDIPVVRQYSSISFRRFEILFPERPAWLSEERKQELHKQLDEYLARYERETV